MNAFKKVLAVTALAAAIPMVHAAEISGNVSLASDYVWRGISQTMNNGAIQGGFDVETGVSDSVDFYAGVWGSNVDFGAGSNTSIELDYYGGFTFAVFEDLSLDLGYIAYTYPGQSDLNFEEVSLAASYMGFTLSYSDDNDNDLDYTALSYETELSGSVGLALSFGNYDSGSDDYDNYSIGLSKSFFGVDFGLTYTDTDIDKDDCDDECNSIFAVSMSKSL